MSDDLGSDRLRQLARDYLDGNVRASWDYDGHPDFYAEWLREEFWVITQMTQEALSDLFSMHEPVHFWADLRAAATGVDGDPIVTVMHSLNADEWGRLETHILMEQDERRHA